MGWPAGCRWAAVLGIILALSRAFIQETGVAFDPELALLEVVAHTHHLPRNWRGRAHTREVHDNFQALFPFKVATTMLPACWWNHTLLVICALGLLWGCPGDALGLPWDVKHP